MIVTAEITGLKYVAKLGRVLEKFQLSSLAQALSSQAAFLLDMDDGKTLAVSWWVSPKRTRSYPYARVYDTLAFAGKRVTIIPVFKDEGGDGDRDFLQWDTVSLMSLLGVYVIIGYYKSARRNVKYENKITDQRFDAGHLKTQLGELIHYQSDALHWNLSQIDKIGELAGRAFSAYIEISGKLKVQMHSSSSARKRISSLVKGKQVFMVLSRKLAEKAQGREIVTVQPKEKLAGAKAAITIRNYLGGYYFFTIDEARKEDGKILLIEGKHTRGDHLPSLDDIKDGLLKMILYTNLKNVQVDSKETVSLPVLLLTTGENHKAGAYASEPSFQQLKSEARTNGFQIVLNGKSVKL